MTLIEEINEILDNYIVMKCLTDTKPFPVEVKVLSDKKIGKFTLHRKKGGTVYDISVYEEDQKIVVSRNGIYMEHELLTSREYQDLKMHTQYDITPRTIYDVHSKSEISVAGNTVIWTLYDAKSFEIFLSVIDKII
ncbi:MAG: hypothetical protein K0R18_428 [Bacillales bacterium]|jgi:hypothetical protein|nr:hypothetical protein [Bacillales bacterium]